jgi:rod shape-determining protein MreC
MRAILRGSLAGRVMINNLTADSRIKPGETVLTSGGDQIYPRGLPVGVIESIAPDPEHQPYSAIIVRPAVNLARVEEVLVITGTQSDLPASAAQDLSAAAVQHAADLSAERLPGLHDDQAPGTAPAAPAPVGPGGVPIVVVPHPLPTVHPDRFTTGSTPPAASLTPGAPHTPQADAPQPSTQPPRGNPESPQANPEPQQPPASKPAPPSAAPPE